TLPLLSLRGPNPPVVYGVVQKNFTESRPNACTSGNGTKLIEILHIQTNHRCLHLLLLRLYEADVRPAPLCQLRTAARTWLPLRVRSTAAPKPPDLALCPYLTSWLKVSLRL